MRWRVWFLLLGSLALLAVGFVIGWPRWVKSHYQPQIHPVAEAPSTRVAVVFGARVYRNGRLSAMLRDRVDTAIALYKAGKVQKLLVSGDNQFADYNEPGAMMEYAISQGVPAEDIQPDYAGRRTYDTCYRLKAIFQVDEAILVTQAFHLPRALFTCEQLGVTVTGVAADQRTYDPRSIAFSETREIPALAVALLDVIRRAPPAVLGEPITIE